MEQVVAPVPSESLNKQLQNPSKKGVNKLIRQFRNLGWVKKLQSPKSDAKKQLDVPGISISNANARIESNEFENSLPNSFLGGKIYSLTSTLFNRMRILCIFFVCLDFCLCLMESVYFFTNVSIFRFRF